MRSPDRRPRLPAAFPRDRRPGRARALDAVAAARAANGPSDTRPHVAHIQVIHPDDIPRFRPLGRRGQRPATTGPSTRTRWTGSRSRSSGRSAPRGSTRSGRCCAPAPCLAMGSDWSVSSANLLLEIEVAVDRVADSDRTANPFLPDERLDARRGPGRRSRSARPTSTTSTTETGTLEVGKLADLAVLDRDLFDPGRRPIGDARVIGTFVEGFRFTTSSRASGHRRSGNGGWTVVHAHSASHVGMA